MLELEFYLYLIKKLNQLQYFIAILVCLEHKFEFHLYSFLIDNLYKY